MEAPNVIDLAAARRAVQREQRAVRRSRASQPKRPKVRQLVRRDEVRQHAAAAL